MSITVSCQCQSTYRVKDELAGKTIKCPRCKQPTRVPLADLQEVATEAEVLPDDFDSGQQGDTIFDDEDDGVEYQLKEEPAPPQRSYSPPQHSSLQSQPGHGQPGYGQPGYGQPGYGQRTGDGQQPGHRQQPGNPLQDLIGGVNMSLVMSGVGMMVGAAIWFFAGLAFGVLFYYPPILFIFGIISLVAGFMGSE